MADYRLLWADIKSPTAIQGELSLETFGYSKIQNSPGIISATIPIEPYRTTTKPDELQPTAWYQLGPDDLPIPSLDLGTETDALTRETAKALFGPNSFGTARTVVYIERDGVILKSGLLWGHNISIPSNNIVTIGEGWLSYFRRRIITNTLKYNQVDQDAIARSLIDTAQAEGGGDVGIQTVANLHGVLRDRHYPWFDGGNVGERLEQLSAVINGFDFDFVSSYNTAGEIETTFRTYYPANGRDTSIVLEQGSNMDLVSYTEDGKAMVNQARLFGSGLGNEVLTATETDTTSIVSYPLLQASETRTDISRQATLTSHALRRLKRGALPATLLTCQMYNDTDPELGSYELGDRVLVSADYGYVQFDRAPFRIVSQDVKVSQEQGEVSTVVLARQELFDADVAGGGGML